ncbi:MAG: SDR family NAD(P)-dependent oxidoreductase [Solirubrobacteraceae bacterium]
MTSTLERVAHRAYTPMLTPARALSLLRAPSLAHTVRGKRVLVTGASSGIGRCTALRLGAAGAEVLLVARTQAALEQVQAEISTAGGTAHVLRCDMTNPDCVDRLAADVVEQFGGVDVLINNAGHSIRRSVMRSVDRAHDFERTMQLNYFGALRLTLGLLEPMRQQRSGQVVNISTLGLQTSTPRFSAYLASKAALDAFARSLGAETRHLGIRVSTVYVPLVRTPMISATDVYDGAPALRVEDAVELIVEAVRTRATSIKPRAALGFDAARALVPQRVEQVMNLAYLASRRTGTESSGGSLQARVAKALRVRI